MNIAKKHMILCQERRCHECEYEDKHCTVDLLQEAIEEIDACYEIIKEQREEIAEYERSDCSSSR